MDCKNIKIHDDELELDKLIDEIEDKQIQQKEMMKIKDKQIENLKFLNKELEIKVSKLSSELGRFKKENAKLNQALLNNQKLFDYKINQHKNEIETLVSLTSQLEKQNEQINELQRIKQQQEEEYKQIEITNNYDL